MASWAATSAGRSAWEARRHSPAPSRAPPMRPECSRHRDRTQRSAYPNGPRKRPRADVPGDRKAVLSRTPC
eukprot:12711052-Alexandrium_andersonii.AAC.1